MSLKLVVVAFSLLILQAGVGPILTINSARPSFLLPFVVFIGFHNGSLVGCVTGFVLGFAIDTLGNLPLGMSSLAFSIAGFFSGRIAAGSPFRLWWPWTTLVLMFAVILEILRMLVLARANQLPFLTLLLWSGLPSALWTSTLAVIWFLSPLHKREGAIR